jgi:hypothetical protein
MRYKNVKVKYFHGITLGKYRNGIIYLRPNLDKKTRKLILEHEFLHYKFFSNHKFMRPFQSNTTNILLLTTAIFSYYLLPKPFNFLSFLLLIPLTIILLHELKVFKETKDLVYGIAKTILILVLIICCYLIAGLMFK